MSELIDRQALLDECLNHYEAGNIEQNCTMDWICKTVRNAPTASPWHRVEDGDFPKNDESVFVYCETTGGIIKSTYHEFVKDGERIYWAFGGQLRKYWMPLPEPPKEEK